LRARYQSAVQVPLGQTRPIRQSQVARQGAPSAAPSRFNVCCSWYSEEYCFRGCRTSRAIRVLDDAPGWSEGNNSSPNFRCEPTEQI